MLSIPLQQIARTVTIESDTMSAEQIDALSPFFTDESELETRYNPRNSDRVKDLNYFKSDIFDENPGSFAKLWFDIGREHPLTYTEAFLLQNYGYWYPDTYYWSVYYFMEPNDLGLTQDYFTSFRVAIFSMFESMSRFMPTAILFSPGLFTWILLFAFCILILKRRRDIIPSTGILFGILLTAMASPIYCELRYVYGIVVSTPFILVMSLTRTHIQGNTSVMKREENG